MRPDGRPPKLKISELEEDILYFLCPDETCNLFFEPNKHVPCDYDCPKKEDLVKIVSCNVCKDMIELNSSYHTWRRIDHKCSTGVLGCTFLSGERFGLLYDKPTKD